MKISIIIPTYNEADHIDSLIRFLQKHQANEVAEIIVCDAESTDDTIAIAKAANAITLSAPSKGRARQMNYGAANAKGDILYFVHADTTPPATFATDIIGSVKEGFDLGRYTSKYLSNNPILRINEWFTHLDLFICMGGDQTLFVKKQLFQQLHGFKEDMLLMEEYEFCKRAREVGKYKIMKGSAIISARKYEHNSWWQVQKANYKVVKLYKKGASQQEMVQAYKKMLR